MSRVKIYRFLASNPGTRYTARQIREHTGTPEPTVKDALRHLVIHDEIKKHYPEHGGLTHYSVEEDTRPEIRPLKEMQFCGAIFTPPISESSRKTQYHQLHDKYWLTDSEKLERAAIERGA